MTRDQIIDWIIWPAAGAAIVGFGVFWMSCRIP